MCNCGRTNCRNSCDQYVCRSKNITKCVVNDYGTNCYTVDKTNCYGINKANCGCTRCQGRNYLQNHNNQGYCIYQENKCGEMCPPKCCNVCPPGCPDKYKWAPKKVCCEEKKTCCEVDVKFGWKDEPKKCHKKKLCSLSSSSSDSSSCGKKKKWCCKACKRNYYKKHKH